MFTAAVFKDLLLPLFDEIKNSLILFPLKSTKSCNFSADLNFLLSNNGLNPKTFTSSITTLNNIRKQANSREASQMEMFNYYVELEYISIRFSIKNFSYLEFSWTDAFTPHKNETQTSLAFEKSNTLFNIAAKLNNDSLSLLNTEKIKSSVRDLCISGTIYDWISTNFANAPLNDIKPDCSKILSFICLLQAQELAFFSSIQEGKGLKTLARLSLGVMNLVQSVKDCLSTASEFSSSLINQRLEEKASIHTFIHCLVMAEFWDGQELYDIAHDLFLTSSRVFENSLIKNKGPITDYLKISILRSEKERLQISYEGKKAVDSKVKLDPYFLASILDFNSIIKTYSSTYTSLFVNVYPMAVIELQSEFEAKANTIIKTLERASEEVTASFGVLTAKILSDSKSFIIESRSSLINENIIEVKNTLHEIDAIIDSMAPIKNIIISKYGNLDDRKEIDELFKSQDHILSDLDKYKVRLFLNDSALVQTMLPLMKEFYLEGLVKSKEILHNYEENSKIQISLYENMQNEIKNTDLREAFLSTETPSNVITTQINLFDNSAIEILRVIESQRGLVTKCQQYWNHLVTEGSQKMLDTLPDVQGIPTKLIMTLAKLNLIKKTMDSCIKEMVENEEMMALQYKAKLMELLNKY